MNVAPADFSAVRLQADRAFRKQWILAIKVVLHDRVVHNVFSIQPDTCARSDLTNAKTVPFSERPVGEC